MFGSAALLVLTCACGGGGGASEAERTSGATVLASSPASPTSPGSPTSAADPKTTATPAAPAASAAQTEQIARSEKVTAVTVRAFGKLAQNVAPVMELLIDGTSMGTVEVRASQYQDYVFPVSALAGGARVDVVLRNHAVIAAEGRELVVAYVTDGLVFMAPSQPGVTFDAGIGQAAFDGQDTSRGSETMRNNGALRFTWPSAADVVLTARQKEASRFLQQASFGPTQEDIVRLQDLPLGSWIDEQMALPATPEVLNYIQSKYDRGADYLPFTGSKYSTGWLEQKFWSGAATGSDQLRKRVALALHEIFVVSQADSNLFHQSRAYASYVDSLHRLAFGNFRALIEEVSLSPAMGIYLSHMRNRKEDASTNRLPDENFARELMQLFTIGLHELNIDGSERMDAQGKPIETYNNNDVMAMAKVFTGWSWGYDDEQLTEQNFVWGTPLAQTTGTSRVDVRRMKAYPGMASTAPKRLFTGQPHAVEIAANTSPAQSVRMALDALFNHPNVGPFIGRQLIQRLVTSNPSPAYITRVAQAFNNNGAGVRGDMSAVVRAVLLDSEARSAPGPIFGKIREPILRIAQWMRTFGARSASGEYLVLNEPQGLGQRANYMSSVFGFFRPGYVPPNTSLAAAGLTAPEMQIVDESSTAIWINSLDLMLYEGLGWHGTVRDVTVDLSSEMALIATAPQALIRHLDLMLFAGQMSPALKKSIMDAMQGVSDSANNRDLWRARAAVFVAMTSPEYIVQR